MAGTCGGPVMGGRRRKSVKKSKSRKMRGGMGYGFTGAVGTNGADYTSSWGGEVTKDGTPVLDSAERATGGRRRKSKKSKKSKRGGNDEDPQPLENGPVNGDPEPETEDPKNVEGGRRRRKSRKASKKAKKSRRKTMRGGGNWQSTGAVGYGFTGNGSRGLADATGYASKVPPAGGPSQNPDGAYAT